MRHPDLLEANTCQLLDELRETFSKQQTLHSSP